MAPGRGSIKVRVDPSLAGPQNNNNDHLEQLEASLEQMQHEFEMELEEYEKTEQKLRRMKSNLLAADFMETFLHEEDEEEDQDATVLISETENNSETILVKERPVSQNVIESEVVSPSKMFQSPPGSPVAPVDNAARQKMQLISDKIVQLETLMDEYRSGLRIRMDKIKKTENQIKTLSMCFNESRSPSRDREIARSLFIPEDEEEEDELLPHSPGSIVLQLLPDQPEEEALDEEQGQLISVRASKLENGLNLQSPEKRPIGLVSVLSPSYFTSTSDLKKPARLQVASPSPAVMAESNDHEVDLSVAEEAADEGRFKISKKSWMFFAAVNVFVIFITVGVLIIANVI